MLETFKSSLQKLFDSTFMVGLSGIEHFSKLLMIIQWTFFEFIEHNTQEIQRNKKKRGTRKKIKIINSSILHQIFDFWRNCFLIPRFCCFLNSYVWLNFLYAKTEARRFKNSIETNIARRGAPRQIFISYIWSKYTHVSALVCFIPLHK